VWPSCTPEQKLVTITNTDIADVHAISVPQYNLRNKTKVPGCCMKFEAMVFNLNLTYRYNTVIVSNGIGKTPVTLVPLRGESISHRGGSIIIRCRTLINLFNVQDLSVIEDRSNLAIGIIKIGGRLPS